MLKRTIYLKRNVFLLQLLVFFPLVFFAGVFSFIIDYTGFRNWDKIFLSVMFIIEIIVVLKIYFQNKFFIQLSDNEIQLCKKVRGEPKIINSYTVDAIKSIECNDKRKEIKFLYHNCPEKYFLKFKYSNLIGEEVYFSVKSELCRYYPAKTVDCRDEYIEKYLENGAIPEYIKSKQFFERCRVIVILFFEFIFAVIPIGLTVLSVIWSLLGLWIIMMKGFLYVLNFFFN